MPISKEQWDGIEKELSGHFGRVELRCDGHEIIAAIAPIAPLRQAIVVYIDGHIKGEWLMGKNELACKFHRESKRFLYSKKQRDQAKLSMKRRGNSPESRKFWNETTTLQSSVWYPWWTNAKAFLKHISKTCTEIEVVKIGFG